MLKSRIVRNMPKMLKIQLAILLGVPIFIYLLFGLVSFNFTVLFENSEDGQIYRAFLASVILGLEFGFLASYYI